MFCSVSPTYLLIRSLACRIISGLSSALRDVLGQRGLAGARRPVETQGAEALAAQRLDDARDLETRLDVEQARS